MTRTYPEKFLRRCECHCSGACMVDGVQGPCPLIRRPRIRFPYMTDEEWATEQKEHAEFLEWLG